MDFFKKKKKFFFFFEIYKINSGRTCSIGSVRNREQTIFFFSPHEQLILKAIILQNQSEAIFKAEIVKKKLYFFTHGVLSFLLIIFTRYAIY